MSRRSLIADPKHLLCGGTVPKEHSHLPKLLPLAGLFLFGIDSHQTAALEPHAVGRVHLHCLVPNRNQLSDFCHFFLSIAPHYNLKG